MSAGFSKLSLPSPSSSPKALALLRAMAAAQMTPFIVGGAAALAMGLLIGGSTSRASSAPKYGAAPPPPPRESATLHRCAAHESHPGNTLRHYPQDLNPTGRLAHHDSLDETMREVHSWFCQD